jgi:hypothetical protein
VNDEGWEQRPPQAREYIAHSRALREAMPAWAERPGGMGSGGARDGYGEITFHWEIGPGQRRAELRLWVGLNDHDRPVIRVSFPAGFDPRLPEQQQPANIAMPQRAPACPEAAITTSNVQCLYGTDLPPVQPAQRCDACGAQGTVGRAIRFTDAGEIHEMHRSARSAGRSSRRDTRGGGGDQRRRAIDAHRRSGAGLDASTA